MPHSCYFKYTGRQIARLSQNRSTLVILITRGAKMRDCRKIGFEQRFKNQKKVGVPKRPLYLTGFRCAMHFFLLGRVPPSPAPRMSPNCETFAKSVSKNFNSCYFDYTGRQNARLSTQVSTLVILITQGAKMRDCRFRSQLLVF